MFLCAEATLFGTLLATYFYLDFNATRWPPAGIKAPSVVLPLVATGVLVASTVPMFLAARAARTGDAPATCWLIALALVIQCCYLAGQILLFGHGTGASSAVERLMSELNLHHAELAARVIGCHLVDEPHLTEGQLLAMARQYFRVVTTA